MKQSQIIRAVNGVIRDFERARSDERKEDTMARLQRRFVSTIPRSFGGSSAGNNTYIYDTIHWYKERSRLCVTSLDTLFKCPAGTILEYTELQNEKKTGIVDYADAYLRWVRDMLPGLEETISAAHDMPQQHQNAIRLFASSLPSIDYLLTYRIDAPKVLEGEEKLRRITDIYEPNVLFETTGIPEQVKTETAWLIRHVKLLRATLKSLYNDANSSDFHHAEGVAYMLNMRTQVDYYVMPILPKAINLYESIPGPEDIHTRNALAELRKLQEKLTRVE